MMVNTAQTDNNKWRQNVISDIVEWDMDQVSEEVSDDVVEEDLNSEEAIEAMWAKGAQAAMAQNMEKPSFSETRLG